MPGYPFGKRQLNCPTVVRQLCILRVGIEAREDTDAAICDNEFEFTRLNMESNVASLRPLAMSQNVSHQLCNGGYEFAAVIGREAGFYAEPLNPVDRVNPNGIACAYGRHWNKPELRPVFEKPSLFAVCKTPEMPAVEPACGRGVLNIIRKYVSELKECAQRLHRSAGKVLGSGGTSLQR